MRSVLPVLLLLLAAAMPVGPASASTCSGGPANDCMEDALEWFAESRSFSNVGATMEPGEPTTCDGETVHNSVWLRLDVIAPGANDPFKVVFDAPFWMTTGVYTKATDGTLAQVSCISSWEDEGLHSPTHYLSCGAGTTYWIQIGGRSPQDVGTFSMYESQYWKFDRTVSEGCTFKATLPTEPRLAAPTPGHGTVSLHWVEPSWEGGRNVSLTHYNVYRADTCAGTFSFLASTAYRGYTDQGLPDATSFCYKVTAVNVVGEGTAEPGRSATTWNVPRPPRSLAVQAAGDGELALTWLSSFDHDGPAPMVEQRVYRAASSSGPFTLLGTVAAGVRTYTDTGIGQGETWHYRLSAVNVVGESAPGGTQSGATWELPGAPRDVQARAVLAPPGSRITWQAPAEDAPFTHYRVYRATSPEGTATFVGEVPRATTGFTDSRFGLLVDAYYEVRASNPAGVGAASGRGCSVYPLESPLARCG